MKSIRTPVACVAFLIFFLSSPAFAQKPLELSISPVRFEFAGYPGQQTRATVRVLNGSEEWLAVALEVEDFAPQGEEGKIAVGPGASGERSLVLWVRPLVSAFEVPPRSRYPVEFVVDIPVGAEPGTYYGTILARTTSEQAGAGPVIVTKVGAILLVDVYGEVREELSLASVAVPRFSWKMPVDVTLRFANTGTVRERTGGTLSLSNMFGKELARLALPEENVLPGAVRRIGVPIREGLRVGRYTARLEATYGLQNQVPLSFETQFWFIDWKNVGLPFLILLGTFLFLLSRRKNFRPALRALRTGRTRPEVANPKHEIQNNP